MNKRGPVVNVRGIHLLGDHRVRLLFSDGCVRDLDLAPVLWGPAFARHRADPSFFAEARVHRGTVSWPDDSDLDPAVLHGDVEPATGPAPVLLAEVLAPAG